MSYFAIINSMNKLDGNASTFLSAAGITDWKITQAINNLVKDLKTTGIWSKCYAIYPFVGGTSTTHQFNLINPLNTNAAYRLTFTGTWAHSSTGALPNGSNAYATTFINANTVLTQSNTHLSFYSRTNVTGNGNSIGTATNVQNNPMITMFIRDASNATATYNALSTAGAIGTNTDSRGFYISSKLSSAIGGLVLYKNGSSIASNTIAITTNNYPSVNIYIAVLTPTIYFDSKECAFASVGLGLTATESSTFNSIVTNFQTALGRNV